MNTEDLKLCKAFAKLDGVSEFEMHRGYMYAKHPKGDLSINGTQHRVYNPLVGELQLNARDKYGVTVEHLSQFDRGVGGTGSYNIPFVRVRLVNSWVNTPSGKTESLDISRAVLKCILYSRGVEI